MAVDCPQYNETALKCYGQEMLTGGGLLLPHTLSMPSTNWAYNEDLWLCMIGADRH
jgi:hypothetical protein